MRHRLRRPVILTRICPRRVFQWRLVGRRTIFLEGPLHRLLDLDGLGVDLAIHESFFRCGQHLSPAHRYMVTSRLYYEPYLQADVVILS